MGEFIEAQILHLVMSDQEEKAEAKVRTMSDGELTELCAGAGIVAGMCHTEILERQDTRRKAKEDGPK